MEKHRDLPGDRSFGKAPGRAVAWAQEPLILVDKPPQDPCHRRTALGAAGDTLNPRVPVLAPAYTLNYLSCLMIFTHSHHYEGLLRVGLLCPPGNCSTAIYLAMLR